MKTLLARCQVVGAMMSDLESARRNQHVRASLEERASEWNEQRAKLSIAHDRAGWIDVRPGQSAQFVQRKEQLSRYAKEAVQRLASGVDVATLTEDPLWTKLLKSAVGANEALDQAVRDAWREFVDKVGTLESPAALEATLSKTPVNRQAIEIYRPRYAEVKKLAEQPHPRSAADKAALKRAVAECRKALESIQRDVPKEVDKLFRAVDANEATLALVTPTVFQWLSENGQLERYQVRIAGK